MRRMRDSRMAESWQSEHMHRWPTLRARFMDELRKYRSATLRVGYALVSAWYQLYMHEHPSRLRALRLLAEVML